MHQLMVKNKGWTNTLYWYKYLHLSHVIVDNGVVIDDLILVSMMNQSPVKSDAVVEEDKQMPFKTCICNLEPLSSPGYIFDLQPHALFSSLCAALVIGHLGSYFLVQRTSTYV